MKQLTVPEKLILESAPSLDDKGTKPALSPFEHLLDLLKVPNIQNGLSTDQILIRSALYNTLMAQKGNPTILLEEADYQVLRQCQQACNFQVFFPELVALVNMVYDAKDVKPGDLKKKEETPAPPADAPAALVEEPAKTEGTDSIGQDPKQEG